MLSISAGGKAGQVPLLGNCLGIGQHVVSNCLEHHLFCIFQFYYYYIFLFFPIKLSLSQVTKFTSFFPILFFIYRFPISFFECSLLVGSNTAWEWRRTSKRKTRYDHTAHTDPQIISIKQSLNRHSKIPH